MSATSKARQPRRSYQGRTISIKRMLKRDLDRGRSLYPEVALSRPLDRGVCRRQERPCPYVSCQYHLYLDVHERTGAIKLNFPGLEVWELDETCALDVADNGVITLREIGDLMNITRERVRQIETIALTKLCRRAPDLAEHMGDL